MAIIWQLWQFGNDDFPENQLAKFSVTDMRTNKGGVTDLNVGTQIICERSEQKVFWYPTLCPVTSILYISFSRIFSSVSQNCVKLLLYWL